MASIVDAMPAPDLGFHPLNRGWNKVIVGHATAGRDTTSRVHLRVRAPCAAEAFGLRNLGGGLRRLPAASMPVELVSAAGIQRSMQPAATASTRRRGLHSVNSKKVSTPSVRVAGRGAEQSRATACSVANRTDRHDVQGLRSIAVLMVVLYQFGVPGVSGGSIGVDVFFVILKKSQKGFPPCIDVSRSLLCHQVSRREKANN